ncbi:Stress response protein nst1, partial [Linderina macrospora]
MPLGVPKAPVAMSNSTSQIIQKLSADPKMLENTKAIWNSDRIEEQRQVRKYWLSLNEVERRAFVLIEKDVVMSRVREHQNFSCSCNSCTRKREAIEHELDCLYDCYYEELEVSVRREKMRQSVLEAEDAASDFFNSAIDQMIDLVFTEIQPSQQTVRMKNSFRRKALENFYRCMAAGGNPDALRRPPTADKGADGGDANDQMASLAWQTIKSTGLVERSSDIIMELCSRKMEYQREFGDKAPLDEDGGEDPLDNNDLFYTDNLLSPIESFPADSKKFFDMMERLADYRMRREDALLENIAGSGSRSKGECEEMSSHGHHHHHHHHHHDHDHDHGHDHSHNHSS